MYIRPSCWWLASLQTPEWMKSGRKLQKATMQCKQRVHHIILADSWQIRGEHYSSSSSSSSLISSPPSAAAWSAPNRCLLALSLLACAVKGGMPSLLSHYFTSTGGLLVETTTPTGTEPSPTQQCLLLTVPDIERPNKSGPLISDRLILL